MTKDPQDFVEDLAETPLSVMSAYDLIDLLNTDYPHRCLAPGEDVREAERYAGKRELVDMLMAIREEERNTEEDARDAEEAEEDDVPLVDRVRVLKTVGGGRLS